MTTNQRTLDGGQVADSAVDEQASDSDEYGTPAYIIRRFHDAISGRFDLDPAAGAEPIRIANERYTREDDGLTGPWHGERVWLNPPYSDPEPWLRKVTTELRRDGEKSPQLVLALLKGDTSTGWFHNYVTRASYLCLVDHRVSFHGADGTPNFPSILAAFGDVPESVLDALDEFGSLYRRHTLSAIRDDGRLGEFVEDGGLATMPTTGQTTVAPTAGLQVSLDRLQAYQRVSVAFDNTRLGAVRDLPDEIVVDVLPDGHSFDTERGEIRVNCLAPNRLSDDGDLYVQLRESAYAATRVEVAVSVRGEGWELAPVETIQHVSQGVVSQTEEASG